MKKIIALGGSGMTGYYLPPEIANYDLIDGYDITDPVLLQAIFKKERPDVVLLLAAVTDVVGAETDRARCYEVNTIAPYRVALLCQEYGASMIFISSVDVFDGTKTTPYDGFEDPNPVVVYGWSKLMAEKLLETIDQKTRILIIRAGWMFGGFEKDKKFVSYMIEQMLSGKETIKAVNDIKGSPTYGKDLIDYILTQCNESKRGIIHFCNDGQATRYDQAKLIAEVIGYKGKVEPATMGEFPNFRALKNSVMMPSVITRSWEDALTEYITLWKERIA